MDEERFDPAAARQNPGQIEIYRQAALLEDLRTFLASGQGDAAGLLEAVEEIQRLSQVLALRLEEAEKNRADYPALFEQSPCGYVITDRQGRIKKWNRAAEALLNPPCREGQAGLDDDDLTDGLSYALLADFVVPSEQEHFYACLTASDAVGACEWKAKARHDQPAGNGATNTYLRLTRLPVQAGTQHYFWMVRDEAEHEYQVQLLSQLEAERARLSTIIANMPGAIIVTDRDSRVILSNPAADQLYARPVTSQKSLDSSLDWTVCYPDGTPYRPEDLPIPRSAEHGETHINLELLLVWPDGQQRSLQVNSAPILDRKGRVRGAVALLKDITQHKQAEASLHDYMRRLERSNSALQDFASIASHDLQEPLRKVQAFGDRLRDRMGGKMDAESLDYLNRMQNAAERMSVMIRDLLAYSRVTTKAQPAVQVDLNEVARESKALLELAVEESDGYIEVDDLPVIEAEPLQMRQLFQNLMSNSLKFSKPGVPPHLRIYHLPNQAGDSSHESSTNDFPGSEQVVIVFEDNGIGFDQRYAELIFQPFQRLHGLNHYQGNGMGLAICRKIVERHGGTISASSVPGQGTTFRVSLPVKMPASLR